jgi:hypothetical protein
MKPPLRNRIAWSVLLAGLGVVLGGYGLLRYQVGTRNIDFALNHASARLFPQTWLWEGHRYFYDRLDPEGAADAYRQAVARHNVYIEAWFSLAKAEIALGHREAASKMLQVLSSSLAEVSTWKWQECLVAFDLKEDHTLESAFNFILERMPRKVRDACFLARQYWGSWAAVAHHVRPANEPVLLQELIAGRELDAACELWDRMDRSGRPPERALTFRLCHALLHNQQIPDAKAVWNRETGIRCPRVHNGSFEEEPLNLAFGWRLAKHPDVAVERTPTESFDGRFSIHVRFLGTANVHFHHVTQILPVDPGAAYRLRFARKSRGLTTDQGVSVEVFGYACKGLYRSSDPVLGTQPWTVESLEFQVPEGCEAVAVRLRRRESLKFDNKILGDYWLDSVSLEPT